MKKITFNNPNNNIYKNGDLINNKKKNGDLLEKLQYCADDNSNKDDTFNSKGSVSNYLNMVVGSGQIGKSILSIIKDLSHENYERLSIKDISLLFDHESERFLSQKDFKNHKKLKIAGNHLRQIKEEHIPLFKKGLIRLTRGIGLELIDLIGLPLSSVKTLECVGDAVGISFKPFISKISNAFGKTLKNTTQVLEDNTRKNVEKKVLLDNPSFV